jgi:hypothetical protein
MNFDELQEVCEDYLLLPFELLPVLIEDLDAGDIFGKAWISGYLHPHDAQRDLEVGRKLEQSLSTQGKRSFSAMYL